MTEEATAATTTSTTATEASAAVPIPTNINLNVDLKADRVKYDNINLDQMLGQLVMRGGQAVIEDGSVYITFGSPGTACLDTKTGEVRWQHARRPVVFLYR